MFKKILLSLIFVHFAYANLIISDIKNGFIYASSNGINPNDLKAGVLVIKNINGQEIIIARAKFKNINNEIAKFELYVFSDLKQSALPIPRLIPEKGDKLILNSFINHAFLIAPSKKDYIEITSKHNNFNFFSTDVLAAKLYEDSKLMPTRNDIRNYCKEWAIGSVMAALNDGLYLFECSSLDNIAKLDNKNYKNEENINFYSNISKTLSNKTDYFSYYNKLFQEME